MDDKRLTRVWEILSWGFIAVIPANIGFAVYCWARGVPVLTGLFLSCALYVAWSNRSFLNLQLTRLAIWQLKKQIEQISGKTLTGFHCTVDDGKGGHEILEMDASDE